MSKMEEPEKATTLRLVADSASMQGRSPKQEDRHVKIPDLTKAAKALKMPIDHLDQPCAFFAVYDGHQGHLCVEYVAKAFHMKLLRKLSASNDGWTDERVCGALSEVCEELDTEFLAKYRTAIDGCAVVVALIVGTRVFAAWVGHARCLVCKQPELGEIVPIALTQDHRPSVESEAERVRKAGGIVVDYGGGFARVAHEGYEERLRELRRAKALGFGTIGKEPVALDVSRSLGDREFKAVTGKALLIPTPGVRCFQLDHSHRFVALTCGGVPCVLSDEEIVNELNLVRDEAELVADVRAGCGALVQEAYTRGSDSNLTVTMVRLQWPGSAHHAAGRKLAHVEKDKAAAAAPTQASAAAASKRRRLEAAASISAQKVAAYERAVSTGDAAQYNAAEEARKAAEIAVMKAEVEAAKVEVAKEEAAKLEAAKAQAAEEKTAAAEETPPLAAAEAFFAARKSGKKRAADADATQKAAGAEKRVEPEEPRGLDAADAYFAARRAKSASEKHVEPPEPTGLDAAEAYFAARRAKGAAEKHVEPPEPTGLDAAEAYFAARRSKGAEKRTEPEEPRGLDAAEAYFAAQRAKSAKGAEAQQTAKEVGVERVLEEKREEKQEEKREEQREENQAEKQEEHQEEKREEKQEEKQVEKQEERKEEKQEEKQVPKEEEKQKEEKQEEKQVLEAPAADDDEMAGLTFL